MMTKYSRFSHTSAALLLTLLAVPAHADDVVYPTDLYKAMEWRFVGPRIRQRVQAIELGDIG